MVKETPNHITKNIIVQDQNSREIYEDFISLYYQRF